MRMMTAAESFTAEIRISNGWSRLGNGIEPVHSRIRGSEEDLQSSLPPEVEMRSFAAASGRPARNPAKLKGGSFWAAGATAGGGGANGIGMMR